MELSLLEKVSQDMKEAMKAQEKDRLSALRMLKSALIENKTASAPKTPSHSLTRPASSRLKRPSTNQRTACG
jgi:uncharacterized protein YqeY